MANTQSFNLSDLDTMMGLVESIFSELNIGLLIFHLEDSNDPQTLKLVYANKVASQYTGADLRQLVGKHILEAFPALAGSDLPGLYAEVVNKNEARNIGAFEYGGDAQVEKGYYAIKAFPMPNACVGAVFENITVRKQLEEITRKLHGQEGGEAKV